MNTPAKAGVNKKTYNWSFKPVAQKDFNLNQWPFKFIRDEGKTTKMECRSLSALKDSFNGTTYNTKDCSRVLSRYSALVQLFKERYAKEVTKITHMVITFNEIYFMVENENTVKGGTYSTLLCSVEDIKKLQMGFDVSNKVSETVINTIFNEYKNTKNPILLDELRNQISYYINARKSMVMLDNNKFIIDLFTHYDLNFSSLRYLIVIPSPKVGALDYQSCIYMGMKESGFNSPMVESEICKIPSLKDEISELERFANIMNEKKVLKSLRKVYCLNGFEDYVNKDVAKNLFLACADSNNKNGLLYLAPLTPEERKEIDAKIEALQKVKGEDEQKIQKCKEEFTREFQYIVDIIDRVSKLLIQGEHYSTVTNVVEKTSWVDNMIVNTLGKDIQKEYDYKRSLKNEESKQYGEISSLNAFAELGVTEGLGNISTETLSVFNKIIPTYVKDNRKTINSLNIGFDTYEKAERTVKMLRFLRTQIFRLLEVFIGAEYGIITGLYMKRFKISGMTICVNLMPTIRNKPFVYSKNVLDIAERYLYNKLGTSLIPEDPNFYQTEKGKDIIGEYLSFCKKSIDFINGNEIEPLTHTGDGNEKLVWIQNLLVQLEHLEFIFEQYKLYFHGK